MLIIHQCRFSVYKNIYCFFHIIPTIQQWYLPDDKPRRMFTSIYKAIHANQESLKKKYSNLECFFLSFFIGNSYVFLYAVKSTLKYY